MQFDFLAVLFLFLIFIFLNVLLSFFWLCEEAKCTYLHHHFGQKSNFFKKKFKPRQTQAKVVNVFVFGKMTFLLEEL